MQFYVNLASFRPSTVKKTETKEETKSRLQLHRKIDTIRTATTYTELRNRLCGVVNSYVWTLFFVVVVCTHSFLFFFLCCFLFCFFTCALFLRLVYWNDAYSTYGLNTSRENALSSYASTENYKPFHHRMTLRMEIYVVKYYRYQPNPLAANIVEVTKVHLKICRLFRATTKKCWF